MQGQNLDEIEACERVCVFPQFHNWADEILSRQFSLLIAHFFLKSEVKTLLANRNMSNNLVKILPC
jgi:hypothetical protein